MEAKWEVPPFLMPGLCKTAGFVDGGAEVVIVGFEFQVGWFRLSGG